MKPISPQLKRARARKAAGLCQKCPNPADNYTMCDHCRDGHAKKMRNAYRLKHGIPLEKPVPVGAARRMEHLSVLLHHVHDWVILFAKSIPSSPFIAKEIEEAIRLSEAGKAKPE